jgi:hypothetical protein
VSKIVWVWAVAAVSWATAAPAAPKAAVEPPAGGAGAAAPSGTAGSPGVMPDRSSNVGGPPPAVAVDGAPPPPETEAPPTEPAPPAPYLDEDDSADRAAEARAEARRKRRLRRQRLLDAEETRDQHEAGDYGREPTEVLPEAPRPPDWRLIAPHFLIGVERVTNVLAWSATRSVEVQTGPSSGFSSISTTELVTSGTDVSFLGSGGVSNVFGVPRVAMDGMFANGLTLGGSISYMVTSGKEDVLLNGEKQSVDDPTRSVFIFAPRIGFVFEASPVVGVWLRGGVSRIANSIEAQSISSSGQSSSTLKSTMTVVDLTLDPQLLITPVPHVGITLGAVFDIGVGGNTETSSGTATDRYDVKQSSYGVTAGVVAIL